MPDKKTPGVSPEQQAGARRKSTGGTRVPPAFDEALASQQQPAPPTAAGGAGAGGAGDKKGGGERRKSATNAPGPGPTSKVSKVAATAGEAAAGQEVRRKSAAAEPPTPKATADSNKKGKDGQKKQGGGGQQLLQVNKAKGVRDAGKGSGNNQGSTSSSCLWRTLCCCCIKSMSCCTGVYMSWVNCCVTMPCFSFEVYKHYSEAAKHRKLFTKLGLEEREVGIFYVFYSRIDMDHSGAITIYEMLEFLGVERTDFSRRVFSVLDEDGNGTIDFREFVLALWNYATLNRASLVLFAFDLYDKDGSGQLELTEIKKMLTEVYGDKYDENTHARQVVLDLHERMGVALGMPVYMAITDFSDFVIRHPAMLMPAFLFQDALRTKICGPAFWEAGMKKRMQLSNGEYVSITTLMQAAVNEELARGVLAADRMGREGKPGGGGKESEALNFMNSIGGSVARRRGSNDLGKDKIRDVLERATKAREAASREEAQEAASQQPPSDSKNSSSKSQAGGADPPGGEGGRRRSLVQQSSLEALIALPGTDKGKAGAKKAEKHKPPSK